MLPRAFKPVGDFDCIVPVLVNASMVSSRLSAWRQACKIEQHHRRFIGSPSAGDANEALHKVPVGHRLPPFCQKPRGKCIPVLVYLQGDLPRLPKAGVRGRKTKNPAKGLPLAGFFLPLHAAVKMALSFRLIRFRFETNFWSKATSGGQ